MRSPALSDDEKDAEDERDAEQNSGVLRYRSAGAAERTAAGGRAAELSTRG